MTEELKIAFIGGGIMSESIITSIIGNGLAAPGKITVGEPVSSRREHLSERYQVQVTDDNLEAITGARMIVLAVKPQQIDTAMADLKSSVNNSQVVLSIVAGASIKSISKSLDHSVIVRVMPNTPSQVGQGMSVWTALPGVSLEHRDLVQCILKTLGKEVYVSEEKYLDMATALSASGPAYVFMFLEALIDAGVYLGLQRDMAETLATQTIYGSIALVRESGKHPADLRNMVTSPGGTTAEALLVMEESGFKGILLDAVIAAYEKAITLGGKD